MKVGFGAHFDLNHFCKLESPSLLTINDQKTVRSIAIYINQKTLNLIIIPKKVYSPAYNLRHNLPTLESKHHKFLISR
jgi:hypothetical protein